jgi:hypothetical protein
VTRALCQFSNPEILSEYKRFAAKLNEEQDSYAPFGLSTHDVLRAHFLIANHFYLEGEGLGGIGPRSLDLLRSAVSRQFVSLDGVLKWSDRFDICATLFYGLIKNHPFHDANKRTAFFSILYLSAQKRRVPVSSGERVRGFHCRNCR